MELKNAIETNLDLNKSIKELIRGTTFISLSSLLSMLFGFLFWKIITSYYSELNIGLAASLLNLSALISTLSNLGLDEGLKRFLPEQLVNKKKLFNSSVSMVIFISSGLSFVIYWIIFSLITVYKELGDFYLSFFIFIGLVVFSSLYNLISSLFIALGRGKELVALIFFWGILRIPIPIIFCSYGSNGILLGYLISLAIIILCFWMLSIPNIIKNYSFSMVFHIKEFSHVIRYSIGNFIAVLIFSFPTPILSVITVEILSPADGAYLYIGRMVVGLLYILPTSIAISFLVGAIQNPQFYFRILMKAVLFTSTPLIIGVILFFNYGNIILNFFGQNYGIYSLDYLKALTLAAFPLTVNEFFKSIARLHRKVRILILINSLIAISYFSFSLILLEEVGIFGIGLSWFYAQSIVAFLLICVKLIKLIRDKYQSKLRFSMNL